MPPQGAAIESGASAMSVQSASIQGIEGGALERVIGPIETARGLPNAAYIDPAVFAAERDRVFARNWACIGFAKDIPQAGDLKPIVLFGRPMLMVRGAKGEVRV